MNNSPLPDTVDQITPGLLNRLLSKHPEWNEPPVVAIETTPLESPGSSTYRADLALENGSSKPVVVKLHNVQTPPDIRRNYSGEVAFYQEVAAKSGVPTPVTYVAEWDEPAARQLIIQEFLTGGRIGTAETMLNKQDQERVLSVLAEMHAHWWNSPELDRLTRIRTGSQAMRAGIEQFRSGRLDGRKFLVRFGDRVDPRIADYYRHAHGPETGKRLAESFSSNITLCHYDASAKNIFIPDDTNSRPVLFDWGLVVRGYVGVELAQFLATSTDPGEHDRLQILLAFYHDRLRTLGIDNYSFDKLWNDFRCGCLVRLVAPIALAARGNPRADALALTLLPLLSATAISVNAFDLVTH